MIRFPRYLIRLSILFITFTTFLSSCGVVHDALTITELITQDESTQELSQDTVVRNCGIAEEKTVECSAGTTNNFSIEIGGDYGITGNVGNSLGLDRSSGQSLKLPPPPLGYIYTYHVTTDYQIISGKALAQLSNGKEKEVNYVFQASCSLTYDQPAVNSCVNEAEESSTPTFISAPNKTTIQPVLNNFVLPTNAPIVSNNNFYGCPEGLIAFEETTDPENDYDFKYSIYIMDSNGANKHLLIEDAHLLGWTPTGDEILYSKEGPDYINGGVYALQVNNPSASRKMMSDTFQAAWSSDQKHVAFTFDQPYVNKFGDSYRELVISDLNGSERTFIPNMWVDTFSWSPNGEQLIFSTSGADLWGKENDIFLINADGRNLKQMTYSNDNFYPSWSPDGGKIAFVSRRNGYMELYLYDLNDQTTKKLTTNFETGHDTWSPDSRYIAFTTYHYVDNQKEYGLFKLDVDTSELTFLQSSPSDLALTDPLYWQPCR